MSGKKSVETYGFRVNGSSATLFTLIQEREKELDRK